MCQLTMTEHIMLHKKKHVLSAKRKHPSALVLQRHHWPPASRIRTSETKAKKNQKKTHSSGRGREKEKAILFIAPPDDPVTLTVSLPPTTEADRTTGVGHEPSTPSVVRKPQPPTGRAAPLPDIIKNSPPLFSAR